MYSYVEISVLISRPESNEVFIFFLLNFISLSLCFANPIKLTKKEVSALLEKGGLSVKYSHPSCIIGRKGEDLVDLSILDLGEICFTEVDFSKRVIGELKLLREEQLYKLSSFESRIIQLQVFETFGAFKLTDGILSSDQINSIKEIFNLPENSEVSSEYSSTSDYENLSYWFDNYIVFDHGSYDLEDTYLGQFIKSWLGQKGTHLIYSNVLQFGETDAIQVRRHVFLMESQWVYLKEIYWF